MRKVLIGFTLVVIMGGITVAPAVATWPGDATSLCSAGTVKVGSFCMDKYEASVWEIPACNGAASSNKALIRKVKGGTVKRADLVAGNATQRGVSGADYPCTANGQNCAAVLNFTTCTGSAIFAVSLSKTTLDPTPITPSAFITWFQAQQACSNSRKRLPSNAEWQQAVAGTPDPGPDNGTTDCNTDRTYTVEPTGSRSSCVSTYGAFDMVGNLDEWVADWAPLSTACPGWSTFSNDWMCLSGASTTANGPGALLRGGNFDYGTDAGPLTVRGFFQPSVAFAIIGFRCAR